VVENEWLGEGDRNVAALYKAATMGRSVVLRSFSLHFSLECVEGKYSEVELPLYGVLRSSARMRGIGA
jgi:hypothetical protein